MGNITASFLNYPDILIRKMHRMSKNRPLPQKTKLVKPGNRRHSMRLKTFLHFPLRFRCMNMDSPSISLSLLRNPPKYPLRNRIHRMGSMTKLNSFRNPAFQKLFPAAQVARDHFSIRSGNTEQSNGCPQPHFLCCPQ